MKILFVGDTHGDERCARRVADYAKSHGVERIMQVGDFGYWPRIEQGRGFLRGVDRVAAEMGIPWWFIDGNHEDHSLLHLLPVDEETGVSMVTDHVSFIPRGHRWEWDGVSFVSVPGATSVDRVFRVEGESWFENETLTQEQADVISGAGPADVVVAHDAPHGVPFLETHLQTDVPAGLRRAARLFPAEDLNRSEEYRRLLRGVFNTVRQSLWVHGHHHVAYESTWMECRMVGLSDNGTPVAQQCMVFDTADLT